MTRPPEVRRAHHRFVALPASPHAAHGDRLVDPVGYANAQTSYHDARVALCVALGVELDDVDPCTGHRLA